YPLEFRDRRKANYFQKREQWKITDFLINPMVINNALNDKSSLPDMSEMLAGWLGGGSTKSSSKQKTEKIAVQ
ncbi:LOW QUALITY PROTEIN: ER membrane protein complex subunit 7 homolog, partial [Ruditapes philippinarum]|uniref:LOW QUALITY PROTEIN: ER membrane protein complex subunit 7 homolog n=1 Tax=Ruditapes philippinarum TaxID=129788 RepID=UPI00295B248B